MRGEGGDKPRPYGNTGYARFAGFTGFAGYARYAGFAGFAVGAGFIPALTPQGIVGIAVGTAPVANVSDVRGKCQRCPWQMPAMSVANAVNDVGILAYIRKIPRATYRRARDEKL